MCVENITPKVHCVTLQDGEQFNCAENEKVLHAMERAGLSVIQIGCRGGGCGACRIKVVSGAYDALRMSKNHVGAEDADQGYALACRIIPRGDLVIERAYKLSACRPKIVDESCKKAINS